jgi:hypothetical protein
MRQVIILILCYLAVLMFSGCGEQKAVDIRAENAANLAKVNIGMTKAEVLQIMGDKTAKVNIGINTVSVTNPYRSEIKQVNGHTYEVLYYYTHHDQRDWPLKGLKILDRELTPIVFENGKVIGWGSEFLEQKTSGQ